jgi:hypothetical protein
MSLSSYTRLIHSDWSTSPSKRWAATAVRESIGWQAGLPVQVSDSEAFLRYLREGQGLTLAGFDFPIGLPESYGKKTSLEDFCEAIDTFGSGSWSEFYHVAETADQISIYRPFYPNRTFPKHSSFAVRQNHLFEAHCCSSMDALLRRCERATESRRAACSLFWTLGPNQVGKAAISGWKEIINPARRLGAKLWPFEGSLTALADVAGLVLAETYPADSYGQVGVRFAHGDSKGRQQDRAKFANRIKNWAFSNSVALSPDLVALVDNGFGTQAEGEDAFDAVMGLLGMIEVIEGRRPEGPMQSNKWEGWILGQYD